MLEAVADALGDDLRERLVFVGGCTTALFITDPITLEDVRATDDVDLIVDLAGRVQWAALQETLRERGFTDRPDNDVICRMWLGALQVDFMPDDADILGFGNRWYAQGIETAEKAPLTGGREIKLLTPPLFLATKLEAYRGRGDDDPIMSRDLEDVLLVVDGREELVAEVEDADADIRSFIAAELGALQDHLDFDNFIEGNIRGPEGRVDIVRDRLDALARCDGGG
jgi:predicted nucleotidyltransferase